VSEPTTSPRSGQSLFSAPLLLSALWALLVAVAYYREHPLTFPLSGFRLPGVQALLPILPGIAAFCLAWFAGHGALVLAGCPAGSALAAVTALPAGLMLAAAAGLIFGSTWGFSTGSLAVTILFLSIFAGISLRRTIWQDIYSILSSLFRPFPVRAALAVILLVSALDLPGVTAPSIAYDDQVYHLTITRLYRETGRLGFLPDLPPANRPQSFHLFTTWISLIGSDVAIRTINGLLAPAIAILLLLLTARALGPTAGACAALAWTLHPQVSWLARTAYTDLLIVYLALAALFAAWRTAVCRSKDVSTALLCLAVVAGYAAQVKTSGAIIAFLALFAGIFAVRLREDYAVSSRTLMEQASWFCFGLLVIASPWYIRNWLMVGNPFYPHFSSLWAGGGHIPAPHTAFSTVFHTPMPFVYLQETLLDRFGMGRDPLALFLLPWNVTVHCHLHDAETSLIYFDGQIGFVPLAIAPALLFRCFDRDAGRWFRIACAFAVVTVIGWAFGTHQIRFLLPTLGVFSILAGVLAGSGRGFAALTAALLLAALPHSISFSAMRNARIAPYTRGEVTAEAFLEQQLPFMGAYAFLNRSTASSAHVLPLFEERVYYLDRRFTWMELVPYPFISAALVAREPAQIRTYLKAFGVDHLYLPRTGARFLYGLFDTPEYRRNIDGFFASQTRRIYSDAAGEVFEVP